MLMNMSALILASSSPRRRELLARVGLDFRIEQPGVDEMVRSGESGETLAIRLAVAKARTVAAGTQAMVLAADTVVLLDGRVLGKPTDVREAGAMLSRLSGTEHRVVTGVAVVKAGKCYADTASTRVWFRELSGAEIEAYAGKQEALDAAGAYAVQGDAASFVSRLSGSFSNVIGLPLALTIRLLGRAGARDEY